MGRVAGDVVLVGLHPLEPEREVDHIDIESYANGFPVRLHQFVGVDRVHARVVLVRGDREGERLPIGPQAEPIAVPLGESGGVEQLVGRVDVVLGEAIAKAVHVVGIAGHTAGMLGAAEPEEEDLVHLFAVDRVGETAAEVDVLHQLAHDRVLVALVHMQATPGLVDRPLEDAEVAFFLRFGKDRHVLEADKLVLEIDLAICGAQGDGRLIEDIERRGIDIRELVALGVDLPVVGVALQRGSRGAAGDGLGQLPRAHRRSVRVGPPRVARAEELHPVREIGIRGLLLDRLLVRIGGVELRQIVLRHGETHALEGEEAREEPVRLGKGERDGEVVDLLDRRRLAADAEVGRRDREEILVVVDVLDREHDVVRGERLAIRPPESVAQGEGVDRGVVVDLP